MNDRCTEQRFLDDVAQHRMTILRDDGMNRHVRFKKTESSDMFFDLITWPGCLCYTGDMGTYVFRRLEDMFEFFRTDREYNRNRGRELGINLSYWAEKLEAVDRSGSGGSYQEFSEDRFTRAVIGDLIQWIRSNAYRTTKDERRELWTAVMQEVIGADGDSGGYRKQAAAHDFNHRINHDVGDFCFQDFWDHDVTEYTYRFVWCCYAMAWGIQQYDNAKSNSEVEA